MKRTRKGSLLAVSGRLRLAAVCCALSASFVLPTPWASESAGLAYGQRKRVVTIGVVADGRAAADPRLENIKKQATSLAGTEFELRFPEDKQLYGEFDVKKIGRHVDSLLKDSSVSMVLAFGIVAGTVVGQRKKLSKPVLVPFVLDRKLQGLPFAKGTSGRTNLSYIEFPWSIPRDLEVFREVAAATSVTFLVSQYILDGIPGLAAQAKAIAAESKVEMTVLGVADSADAAIAMKDKAAYIAPLGQLSEAEKTRLHRELVARRIATFSIVGESDVRAGVLVGRRPESSLDKIARRVALDIVRIAGGAPAGSLRVSLKLPERLMINVKTSRAIRLSPSWRVLTEAELIDVDRGDVKRKIDLAGVMKEAIEGNLNIKALELAVSAGNASVRSARSSLLPQIEGSSAAQLIDKDRAIASPRYLWSGTITATQVLWSERAWTGLAVEKLAQKSRKQELATGELDAVGDAAVAYLNVVRAKTAEKNRRENLKATRANLETARTQFDAGATTKADVFRWESQIANDRKALIEAAASRNIGEIGLQKLLNRPPEERFETSDEISSPQATALLEGMYQYLSDPWTFRVFRKFVIAEAEQNSPELRQIDAAIAVQQQLEKSAKRALFSPTVSLTGTLTQRFYRGGSGSSPNPGEPNGTDVFVGLMVSVPLYEGGRYAEIERNSLEVARLHVQRDDLADAISQRAASSLHQMGASFAGIDLSRESASAAKKNYDLVAIAYAQGALRIVDVIDAQNAWFSAENLAADSVYAFLIDWMNVQRALGQFTIMLSQGERADLVKRASAYIAAERLRDDPR